MRFSLDLDSGSEKVQQKRMVAGRKARRTSAFFSALDVRFQQRALREYRAMSHKIAHVSDSPLNAKTSRPDAVVCRGPIDGPTAERLGLSSEVESRLIQPAAPEVARAAEAVLKLVPKNVLPVEGDTAESLVARLESSDWLDGMEVKEGGHGKGGRYVLLNSEEYPQPRRKAWSVLVKEEMEEKEEKEEEIGILSICLSPPPPPQTV